MTTEPWHNLSRTFGSAHPEPTRCRRPRVVVMGRPGAGKGTQGELLAGRLRTQHLSTGELLRHEIEARTELGLAVERIVAGGRLVPAALVMGIVEGNLRGDGHVLDGYPRTLAQAQGLFRHDLLVPDIAIEIDVPEDVAIRRLRARGRDDDAPEVLHERMVAFERDTKPAIALLQREGILYRVDGTDDAQSVHSRIWNAVARRLRTPPTSTRP